MKECLHCQQLPDKNCRTSCLLNLCLNKKNMLPAFYDLKSLMLDILENEIIELFARL